MATAPPARAEQSVRESSIPVPAYAPDALVAAADGRDRAAPGPAEGDQTASSASRRQRSDQRKKRRGAAVVGVIGEVLITLGVVLGLYVVWELVWTDVEANAEASDIRQQIVEDKEWIEPAPAAGGQYAPQHDPAVDPPPVDENPLAVPAFGEAWGILHVPRWGEGYQVPIVEGTHRVKILNKGLIGHYEGTQGPGEIGNFATSAHRTTYGKPYNKVADLQAADSLVVETAQYYFVYKVLPGERGRDCETNCGREIVYPSATRVIWPVPNEADGEPTQRIMTMTTCHPMFSAEQRYVIWGELAYWTDKSEGPLEELAGQG
ncbi:MAG: class E sortase [Bifidobacteriaceae bacterium]|nr:class E sortase [Bifidobacteriaceae bacterium]